eukprot:5939969-Prymnesium_polylepis.1
MKPRDAVYSARPSAPIEVIDRLGAPHHGGAQLQRCVRAGARHSVRPRYARPVAQTTAATRSRHATLSPQP